MTRPARVEELQADDQDWDETLVLLGGCLPAAVPRLVRDDAGIFSVETKAAAEARLRAVAVAVNGARLFPSRLG